MYRKEGRHWSQKLFLFGVIYKTLSVDSIQHFVIITHNPCYFPLMVPNELTKISHYILIFDVFTHYITQINFLASPVASLVKCLQLTNTMA